ncbi:MAG: AarF/UbiB family protein [Caldilineaceae bacterium]
MIRTTIRTLVYALVLAVTIFVAPGIVIQPFMPGLINIAATYVIFGILFGLINAFVRPLVLFLTARLVISTMGAFAFVINTFLFWLMSLVFPQAFVVQSPALLWFLMGGAILTVVLMATEAVFGLEMPALRSQIETQFYWRWIGMLSVGRRNRIAENLRAAQISEIIVAYTQDIVVEMTPVARLRNYVQDILFGDVNAMRNMTLPEKVRYMIQELGPTFVKFGQIVSSRSAELPPEWQEQLDQLQSNVPPFSCERAYQIVTRELKSEPDEVYAEFEPEPFAAASTAQVHRATLHDGTPVVVKIQRPNIDVAVRADLNIINDLTKRIQRKQEWAKTLDLHGLFDEFGQSILYELNYLNEASNMGLLSRNMAQFPTVHVPKAVTDLTTSKVLTMEFVPGVKINAVEAIDAAGIDRSELAREYVKVMIKQTLFDGFFHADPHPGNVLVNLDTGQINFLDMGLMGELNRNQRMALADVLVSMQAGDGYSLGKAALRLSKPVPGVTIDEADFLEDMDRFAQRFVGVVGSVNVAFDALQEMMRRHGLRLDSNFVLAFKTLMQSEQIIYALDPNLDFVQSAVESSGVLLRQQINADAVSEMVVKQVSRSAREVVYRIPSLVDATTKWLDQYEQGRFSVHVDTSDLTPQLKEFDKALSRSMDRLVVGLVMAGWLVGAAIASTITVEVEGIRISDFAFYMFLIAAVVGAGVVWQAVRRLNRDDDDV